MEQEPYIDQEELRAANSRHDRERHEVGLGGHLRSGWNQGMMIRKGMLTDRKIKKYEKMGYYSEEFRQQRREMQAKKRGLRREGNFVQVEGRLIYSPG